LECGGLAAAFSVVAANLKKEYKRKPSLKTLIVISQDKQRQHCMLAPISANQETKGVR